MKWFRFFRWESQLSNGEGNECQLYRFSISESESMHSAFWKLLWDGDSLQQIQTSPKMFTRHPEVLQFFNGVLGARGSSSHLERTLSRTRGLFKPAFSMSYLLTLVPGVMLEETLVFKEVLAELAASKKRFHMFDLLQRLSFDLIGRTVADFRTKSQTEYSAVQVSHNNAIRTVPDKGDSIWKRLSKSTTSYWSVRNLD